MKKSRKKAAFALLVLTAVMIGWIAWGNTALDLKEVNQDFEEKMKVYGVQVLHNEAVIIE